MAITAEELLLKIKSRQARVKGIGLAVNYFGMMLPCLDDATCDIGFGAGVDPDKWASAIKEASSKFVYADEDMLVTTGKSAANVFGDTAAVIESTSGACLDFHCVITSTKEDRDGDIIEAGGVTLDPKHPLLYQHNPLWPIGKFVKELPRTKSQVFGHYAIADTVMGRDVAYLIEFGALRISHGFLAKEVEERKDYGFHIKRCEVVETSPVSVPSNTDAYILGSQRGKLHHPVNKAYAAQLRAAMPDVVTGGFDPTGKNAPCGCKTDKNWKATPRIKPDTKDIGVQARQGYDGTFWIGVNLADSWEWVTEELQEAAKDHLKANGVVVSPYGACVCVVGTFSDSAVLAVMPGYGDETDDCDFYRCTWSMTNGTPTFTGKPEEVSLAVTIGAAEPDEATEKSVLKDLVQIKRLANHVVSKLKRARELMKSVMADELKPATMASAQMAHNLVHEVIKTSKALDADTPEDLTVRLCKNLASGGNLDQGFILALRKQLDQLEESQINTELAQLISA